MTKAIDNRKSKSSVYRYLPLGYQPGHYDVLCGRGRKCYFHSGNEHFRAVVQSMIPNYNSATSKMEKGYILSVIVQKIRDRAGIGGFIKQDTKTAQWFEVGDFLAREKVSQAFRDALSNKYKSSNAYKKMRREVEQTGQLFETFLQKNEGSEFGSSSDLSCSADSIQKENPKPMVSPQSVRSTKQTSFTDSLVGLLDQDVARHFQKQSGVPEDIAFDLEPRPIAGPNPFSSPMMRQGDYYQARQELQQFETNCGAQSYPDLAVQPFQVPQALDQLLLLSACMPQNAFQV